MKKVLITGGAGFIGSHLTQKFIQRGNAVSVIDNFITSSPDNIKSLSTNPYFTLHNKDVLKVDIEKLLSRQAFDYVYHLASPASPRQYLKRPIETLLVNSLATHALLSYVKKFCPKASFIFASTSEVYGDPLIHPQDESYWGNVNPVGPRSCYDEGKRFGEALSMTFCRKYNLDVRIARIFNTYGPRMEKDDGRVISNFIVQALSKKPITVYGNGHQTRSFCYIDDLVEGLYRMSTKNIKGEIVNLGNDEEKEIIYIAELIKRMTKSSSTIVYKSLPEDDPKRRKPNISKAKRLLSWSPKSDLETGLMKTIAYFRHCFNL